LDSLPYLGQLATDKQTCLGQLTLPWTAFLVLDDLPLNLTLLTLLLLALLSLLDLSLLTLLDLSLLNLSLLLLTLLSLLLLSLLVTDKQLYLGQLALPWMTCY